MIKHIVLVSLIASIFMSCGPTKEAKKPSVYYSEQHRPQIHFSPEQKWMNDPNGMVFFDGEYHLFYQHYPDSNVWGPMHWGHAVSKDLITWEHLPIALYPDSLGYIFSGSVVVDEKNTSGLGKNGQPPLVAIFTYHNDEREKQKTLDHQTQGIAFSNDRGRTWTKYSGNPVLGNTGYNDFRDPKVFWHEPLKQWIMTLAVYDRIHFYQSPDLIHWTKSGEFGENYGSRTFPWECPDLFELPVEGTKESKWVLLVSVGTGGPHGGSATQYFLGKFDGKQFISDNPAETILWVDYGRDNYAGITWSNIPAQDHRKLFLGWMSNWEYAREVPTTIWRSAMTVPRELTLQKTTQGIRLISSPASELKTLRAREIDLTGIEVDSSFQFTDLLEGTMLPLEVELEVGVVEGSSFSVVLSNNQQNIYRVGFDGQHKSFFSDRLKARNTSFSDRFANELHDAPRIQNKRVIKMHIYFDRSSMELFADDGEVVITDLYFPDEDFNSIKLVTEKGRATIMTGKVYSLKSIWSASK